MVGPPPVFPEPPPPENFAAPQTLTGLWQSSLAQSSLGRWKLMAQYMEMQKSPSFPWRNILIGHSTQRPAAQGGSVNPPLVNEEICQLAFETGGWKCTLQLPNSLQAGDERSLTVIGERQARVEDATAAACKGAFAMLLLRGPEFWATRCGKH